MFVGDAASLSDFEIDEFDLAICMTNTLGNLPREKQTALVRRLRSVLKPGGSALISVYSDASVRARLASYRAIGLRVEARSDRIEASEGLVSEHFTAPRLRTLLEENGLRVLGDVKHVTAIGLAAVASLDSA
jgi:SAM-dependent methyltransferase